MSVRATLSALIGAVLAASWLAPPVAVAQPLPLPIPTLSLREPAPVVAAEAGTEQSTRPGEARQPEALPGSSEVVPRSLALETEAERARAELSRPLGRASVEEGLADLRDGLTRLRRRLASVATEGPLDGDRVARLRARAGKDGARLERALAAASGRYRRLEQLAVDWDARRDFFTRWQAALAADPAFETHAGQLAEALAEIETVRTEIAAAVPAARDAQQAAQSLVRERREVEAELERILDEWEASLRRPSGPIMLTPAFLAELERARVPAGAELPPPPGIDAGFLRDHALTLFVQLAVALLVVFGARWLHHAAGPEDRWHGLLAHPWALGLFAAVAGFGSFYDPAPGLWRLLPAALLSASLARLARGTFANPRERWAIYLLALLHLAFEAAEALGLAEPVARLVMLALAVVPLVVLLPIVLREHQEHGRLTVFGIALRLGVALLVVHAVAEIAGFHPLACWLYQAGIRTTIVIFVAFFVVRLAAKLGRYLLGSTAPTHWRFLSPVREELADRAVRLVSVVAVAVGLLFLADVWHLADSPLSAWRTVSSWSLSLGSYRVTAGQVLLAAGALYAAMVASWLLRAALDERVAQGHGLDRGVGDSMKTLIRYLFIVVGFFLALSLLGIDLSNFAILAGAFGVGIGFGLQNVVNNFVSGLILLFERPVRAGDSVVVAGDAGVIQRIGLRSTVVQTGDRAEVIVPNSLLIAEKVTNWTLSSRVARLSVPVRVAYGSDLREVAQTLLAIAGEHPKVMAEPRPVAQLVALAEHAEVFELRAFLADVELRADVQSELLLAIAERFAARGIVIPSQPWAAQPAPDNEPRAPSEEDRS